MRYLKAPILLGLFIISLIIMLSPLYAVSKEDNDLLFIISLYEHNQYGLAKKQIQVFENDYKTSDHNGLLTFLKANIAFSEMRYSFADSLYTILIDKKIEPSMLNEVLINKAYIKYENNENLQAQRFLNQAEKLTKETEQLYRIELLRGRIFSKLFNHISAKESFNKALSYRNNDATATNELVKSYLVTENESKAFEVLDAVLNRNKNIGAFSSAFNYWIDYQIKSESYLPVQQLEQKIHAQNIKCPESMNLRFAQTHIMLKDYDVAQRLINENQTYQKYGLYLSGLILVAQNQNEKADSIFALLSTSDITDAEQLPDNGDDIAVSSWLERIKILYITNPEQALTYLKTYINDNSKESITPNILYTQGYLLFKSKQYQEAAQALLYVKNSGANSAYSQNIQIMLGDIWFDARINDKAKLAYSQYLASYPQGKFRNHALYNIALLDFEQKDYNASAKGLEACLKNVADEEMNEKASFLLADIDFNQANYGQAIRKYNQISGKYIKRSKIDYRIAQSLYYSGDYKAAFDLIPALISDSTNAFQVLLLEGNIYFNLNQYPEALSTYTSAQKYAVSDPDIREVNSYIALTLYRLKRFNEASVLYLKLSKDKESPQAYLIMAAKASYHAKDYQQSLLLFNQFLELHPDSEFYNNALANIGSIYYNQSEYGKATQTWIELLKRYINNQSFSDDDQIILQTTFSGLQWCLKQSSEQKSLDDINDMIDGFKSEYIRFELQYLLLKVYYGTEQWGDLLQMADDLREQFPHKENNEIRRYVAGSLSKLYRFEEADSVYQTMYKIEPTAEILTEWANLESLSGKTDEAISKLDQALSLDKTPKRYVKLIQTVFDSKPDSMLYYVNKWQAVFNPPPDQVRFLLMQWNFDNAAWHQADSLANDLLLNDDLITRAKAQLIKGIAAYQMQDTETAIMELYKTVYLYPDLPDLVLEAKRYIIKSYLALSQYQEATGVYNEIKDSLQNAEQAEFETLLKAGQVNNE